MSLHFFKRKIQYLLSRGRSGTGSGGDAGGTREEEPDLLSDSLRKNLDDLKMMFGKSNDVKIHEFLFGENCAYKGAIIFIDGLVNDDRITEGIMKPLIMNQEITRDMEDKDSGTCITAVKKAVLCSGEIKEVKEKSVFIEGFLSGDTAMLIDGCDHGLLIGTKGWERRSVTEPQTELVVRGPREGFTENFRTNTALLRRRIKSPNFRLEHMVIGKQSHTNLCVAYIENIAKPEIVKLVKDRLKKLDVDSILDSGYIEEYIEDAPFSVFPTIGNSEKPDVVAAKLLEGRVAIIVDGSPFVLTAPYLFIESYQTAEDYYIRPLFANVTRFLRILANFISIFTVPAYIALTTFHQELLPTTLLLRFARSSEGTPFPAFLEALVMVFSFEILREAGLRLPRPVGQAISIVGALIMGDAAVAAGLVGAPMVIAVAFTAVAGFVIPSQIESVTILRILLMCLSAVLGGFGIAVGFLAILVHLASLKSFGVSYFDAVIPSSDAKDGFVRMPLWSMSKRPKDIAGKNKVSKKTFMPPEPPVNS